MRANFLVFSSIFALVLVCGCIPGLPGSRPQSSTPTTVPRVYVTPCIILKNDTVLSVASTGLNENQIASELVKYYPDDFKIPGAGIPQTYSLKCHWGSAVGEDVEYLYCSGRYRAPDLDVQGVIRRYLWKEFTIAFSIEEHNVGTWVDSSGVTHTNEKVYYLRIKDMKSTCYVA